MAITSTIPNAGISGMALYVPRLRVDLERWCHWTGNDWGKVSQVAGSSFRVCGPRENVYTMAANAVLRLIEKYDIDPERVGMLALGTESSRDNAVGAVIVRGMVDQALPILGLPRLSRNLEVPEFKHACLAGVYALKAALRYVCSDGASRDAIVVAGDIAQYERGSSGEQTQGAGAVAMLVQRHAKMLQIDLMHAGTASAYRGPDFRKPFARYQSPEYQEHAKYLRDFPVFSGKYSTLSYLDEIVHAVEGMLLRLGSDDVDYFPRVHTWFFHRPYRMMPIQAMSFLCVRRLAHGREETWDALEALCAAAGVHARDVIDETSRHPDLYAAIQADCAGIDNHYAATISAARALRSTGEFKSLVEQKMSLGNQAVLQLGNLYSAALPAWLAAGIEDAHLRSIDLTGEPMVMLGYGSGDAAEAIPMLAPTGWQEAASRIRIAESLAHPTDLTQTQYESIHNGEDDPCSNHPRRREFVISHVGSKYEKEFQDLGVEYYDYVTETAAE
ncbi:MAG TPA: hypothetical protein VKP30_33070 [Polyangiaceae bacterium]|nr:hypothetical protein [Polyangiaceae bacterium]